MDIHITVAPTPVYEVYEEGVGCAGDGCHKHLTEEAYFDGVDSHYCEECMEALIEDLKPKAVSFAQEHCKIIGAFPKYEAEFEDRCTPEEYEEGYRESYSPNAYRCHCRHNCTNYDGLLKELDRDSVYGKVFYLAIRDRIEELIEERIEEDELAADDEFDDNEGPD